MSAGDNHDEPTYGLGLPETGDVQVRSVSPWTDWDGLLSESDRGHIHPWPPTVPNTPRMASKRQMDDNVGGSGGVNEPMPATMIRDTRANDNDLSHESGRARTALGAKHLGRLRRNWPSTAGHGVSAPSPKASPDDGGGLGEPQPRIEELQAENAYLRSIVQQQNNELRVYRTMFGQLTQTMQTAQQSLALLHGQPAPRAGRGRGRRADGGN